jgi:hypothetical protein
VHVTETRISEIVLEASYGEIHIGVLSEGGNMLEISSTISSPTVRVELSLSTRRAGSIPRVQVKYTGGGSLELEHGIGLERISR